MSKQDYLTKRFQRKLDEAQSEVAAFVGKVQHDAAYALSWSNSVFQAAAKERVYKQVIVSIKDSVSEDGELDLSNIIGMVTDRVLHKAKYPAQSTSPTSNLIEQYELATWADILSDLNSLKDIEE
jgi:hypothetical protein